MVKRRGYSLVELTVVLVVIAALTALAGMLSVAVLRDNTGRQAETNAWRVLAAEQSHAQKWGSYSATGNNLTVEGLTVTTGPSDHPTVVSVALGVNGSLGIAVWRDEERCVLVQARSLAAGGAVTQPPGRAVTCHGQEALPRLEPQKPGGFGSG